MTKNFFLSLLCSAFNALLLLPLNAQEGGAKPSQPSGWDEHTFRSMAPPERYRFVHDLPFWKVGSGADLTILLDRMLAIAVAENDRHSVLALKYYVCKVSGTQGFKIPEGKNGTVIFTEIEAEAKQSGYEVEEVVAHHFLVNDLSAAKKLTNEQQYVEVQKTFERMEAIGFEKFKDYDVVSILFSLSQFLWDLGDTDKAFKYLTVAERYIEPTDEGGFYYTQVLSYLQTYWKQQKDYDKSIAYAQKILQYHQSLQAGDQEGQLWSRFWQNFAAIDIAALLIEQGKIAEGEAYAKKGYELSKSQNSLSPIVSFQNEFSALMVLIPIKLKLGKLDEADTLLRRASGIQKSLEPQGQLDYFKPLQLYQHFSKYHEMRGEAGAALHYTRLAQTLQDSLDRRNDAHKLAQAQQRYEAEKYAERLQVVENEKQLQLLLRNATLVILLLVLLLAYGSYRRLQIKRRQKEAELAVAKNDLESLTQGFREKSELVENLRLENEKLADQGKHSEYLEQLTNATILTEDDWVKFRAVFEKVHPGFIARQRAQFPDLTPAETRLLVLEKLDLGAQEMANMLGVNRNTINQTKLRLRRKME
ncbi:MAG: hypothetical protein HY842_11060 [Bacteroidetes bacterium]|nr:hypothetical protein [Bacteroidota bacterium]